MALASTAYFASFNQTTEANVRDVSPILSEAIFFDLNLLGNINVDFGSPAKNVAHYWLEDALNPDQVTVSGSVTSAATSITLASGHGLRLRVGDLIYDTVANSTEILQITAISTDTLTVTRAYNSTAAASIADVAVISRLSAEQEGSDISSDRSVAPSKRTNYTQIIRGNDVIITGTELAVGKDVDALADELAHQMANRATELKIQLARGVLYGEPSSSSGSNSVYRSMGGLRYWARDNSGIVDSTSASFAYSVLNAMNKSIVDKGLFPDTLVVGTDLANTVANYDSTNRRLLEIDKAAGYTVNQVMLAQGNSVKVIVDGRVKAGDCFLFTNSNVKAIPLQGRGMVAIAATDFADAKKRRILGEWTLEVRHPEATGYARNKT